MGGDAVGRDRFEDVVFTTPEIEFCGRCGPYILAGIVPHELDDSPRMRIGQRPKQDGIDDCEQSRGRSNAQSQRQHGRDREGRIFAKLPQCVAYIPENVLNKPSAPHVSRHLLDESHVSEFAAGGFQSIAFGRAGVYAILNRHSEMGFEFFVQFLVAIPGPAHGHHLSLGAGPTMAVMAFIICHQRSCSASSCFLPAGVRR